MAENLSKYWKNRAIYLPAIQAGYSDFCTKDKKIVRDGKWPNGLRPNDLNILNPNSKLFHTKGFLYSMGQHKDSNIDKGILTRKQKADKIIVGDSGGYQIGKGTLPGTNKWKGYSAQKAIAAWEEQLSYRHGIMGTLVRSLDLYTDYAATVEIADWCTLEENSPFNKLTVEQCIDLTVQNLDFISSNTGKLGKRTKWLNVLHGGFEKGEDRWYQRVKEFDQFSGWAFGGKFGWHSGVESFIRGLRKLRDDGQLENKEWLHVFGVSRMHWAVLLTAALRGLQRDYPAINLSYDSSSGSMSMANGKMIRSIPKLGANGGIGKWQGWGMKMTDLPDDHRIAVSQRIQKFSIPSSILAKAGVTLNDLNYVTSKKKANKFDELSNNLIVNHNYYMYIKAFQFANEVAFGDDLLLKKKLIPSQLIKALDIIENYVAGRIGDDTLNQNSQLLAAVSNAKSADLKKILVND